MTRIQKAKESASQAMLGFWGSIPNPNHEFFRGKGISFDRAMRDISAVAEVEAAIIARKNAVIGDEWQIIGGKEVDLLRENFETIGAHRIFNAIFDAVWYGYAVLDIPLQKDGGFWAYGDIVSLPCDWFAFDKNGRLVFRREKEEEVPVNLGRGSLGKEAELVRYFASHTNPYGESQLSRVFWPATWLRGNMEYWASYISRFGDDSILVHTELSGPEKKADLLRAITDFRSSGGMVVEGSDTFELLKNDKSSSSLLFKDFAQACRESISKLILGHGSALDSVPGKLGSDRAVNMVRADIRAGDKRLIAEVMNSLIRHLCGLNGIKSAPSFVWTPEAEDEQVRIERDRALYAMGVRFSPEYLRGAYRLKEGDFSIDA